jgi:hypothetical protein
MPKLKKGTVPKPRSDRKLEQLPAEIQAEVLRRIGSVESHAQTKQWLLTELGLRVSGATLSKFYQKTRVPPTEEKPLREILEQVCARLDKIEQQLRTKP